MLRELRVRQMGVVEDAMLTLEPGMTAITGETGAGKTMVVEAIRLLTGGKSEGRMVRTDAGEALIEGRFIEGDDETILSRSIPRSGKSGARLNDRMVPIATLSEESARLVDLHGQHAHQSLLAPAAQRRALDAFGGVDLGPLTEARRAVSDIDASLVKLGGDPQTRAREIDLLRFQLEELDAAQLEDPNEDEALQAQEIVLADAGAHREAAASVHEILNGDGGVVELLGAAVKAAGERPPLREIASQLSTILSEATEVAHESGVVANSLQDDPARLAELQERRATLKQLLRKYGATLDEVIKYREEARERFDELERYEDTVAELQKQRVRAQGKVAKAEEAVRKARETAAPLLAKRVNSRLRELALPNATFEIRVGIEGPGDAVEFYLGPNPGMPPLPLAKAASGGELARTMLALRLSLVDSSPHELAGRVLVFDEVDAGIGGEAAIAVGKALSSLAHDASCQVLVVTHLPQVAAFADQQVSVEKKVKGQTTVAELSVLDVAEREIELARMLSGRPDSTSGRAHARELLSQAGG